MTGRKRAIMVDGAASRVLCRVLMWLCAGKLRDFAIRRRGRELVMTLHRTAPWPMRSLPSAFQKAFAQRSHDDWLVYERIAEPELSGA
jgi:hypothetical protein